MPTMGVPRALLYYRYFPMWRAFLATLGWEVLLSPPTSRSIVRRGTQLGENEICLPLKVFFGHVAALDGKVDAIFVPRVVSVEKKRFTCPKFLALPDLSRALGIETEIVGPTFSIREGRARFLRDAYRLARELGGGRATSARAVARGLRAHREWDRRLRAGDHIDGRYSRGPARGDLLRIGVAGHPYNIYDDHVSLELLKRLYERGVEVLTPEQLSREDIHEATKDIPKGIFWTYENEVVGAVRHWLGHGMVDGVIYALSFSCGPDSFMQVVIEDEARQHGATPLLPLVIDEHSGEAGFVTRLEAFLDMLTRRDRVAA